MTQHVTAYILRDHWQHSRFLLPSIKADLFC